MMFLCVASVASVEVNLHTCGLSLLLPQELSTCGAAALYTVLLHIRMVLSP